MQSHTILAALPPYAGYCLVGKIPPPRGGGVGGLAPNFSILGHQAPSPPPGCGCASLGIWVVQGFETCLNISHILHIFFFILCQSCEPFVAQCCQNWLLAELVVVLDSSFKVLGSNPSGGKFLLVSFAPLFHRFSFFWY